MAAGHIPAANIPGESRSFATSAAKAAEGMKDEFVSVEHVFISLLDHPDQTVAGLLREFGIRKNEFLQILQTVLLLND